MDDHMTCNYCGELIPMDEEVETMDGYVCEDCMAEMQSIMEEDGE